MNAFNRLVMLVVALLLIAAPVFLLLVGLGVLSANEIDAYTNYRGGIGALDGLVNGLSSVSEFDPGVRAIVGAVGFLLALVAGYLLLRELAFGRAVARRAFIEDAPGRETAVTAQAVRRLTEGAAREVGASSPACHLDSEKRRYNISCDIWVERAQNFTELAARAQENIRRVLEEQGVPVKDVEVTVQGTTTAPEG